MKYSRLSLFRLSKVRPPRYTGHLVWHGMLAIIMFALLSEVRSPRYIPATLHCPKGARINESLLYCRMEVKYCKMEVNTVEWKVKYCRMEVKWKMEVKYCNDYMHIEIIFLLQAAPDLTSHWHCKRAPPPFFCKVILAPVS